MTNEDKKASNEAETFDWAELREALDRDKHGVRHLDKVTDREKFVNLMMENPLIPIGCLLTTGCLTFGLISFGRKNSHMSQLMMRGRIMGQGLTIFALLGGVLMSSNKKK